MGWGGPRPGSGRKPGSKSKADIRRVTAAAVLEQIDEAEFWLELLKADRVMMVGSDGEYERVTVPDYSIRMEAAKFLTIQRDGRAFQQLNPAQLQPAGTDPKLAVAIERLLSPGGSITLTEKKMQISGPAANGERSVPQLESATIEAKRETAVGGGPDALQSPLTLDASASSQLDPSGHKAGGGKMAREVHPENFQDSGMSNVPKNGAGVP